MNAQLDLEIGYVRFWQKAVLQTMRDCGNVREAHAAFRWIQTVGIPMAAVLGLNDAIIRREAKIRYKGALCKMAQKRLVPHKPRRRPFDGTHVSCTFHGPRPRDSRLKITKAEFLRVHKAHSTKENSL